MTEIRSYCFYCKQNTKTESITTELNKVDDYVYSLVNLIKCSECHKSTVFVTDGKIQLLKEEASK